MSQSWDDGDDDADDGDGDDGDDGDGEMVQVMSQSWDDGNYENYGKSFCPRRHSGWPGLSWSRFKVWAPVKHFSSTSPFLLNQCPWKRERADGHPKGGGRWNEASLDDCVARQCVACQCQWHDSSKCVCHPILSTHVTRFHFNFNLSHPPLFKYILASIQGQVSLTTSLPSTPPSSLNAPGSSKAENK